MTHAPFRRWATALACLLLACITASPALAATPTRRATLEHAADVRAAAARERARTRPATLARTALLARPALVGAWRSPDGRQVAYLHDEGERRGVWLLATAGGAPRRLLAQTDAETLAWSRDGRWLFVPGGTQLSALAAAGQRGSRALSPLGGRRERSFEGIDPVLPSAAIVIERPPLVSRLPRRWRVLRITAGGRETLLHEDAREIADIGFDTRGALAYVTRIEGDRMVLHRKRGAGTMPVLACADLHTCRILGTAPGGGLLLDTDIDAGHRRLARMSPAGRLQTLHSDPRNEADLEGVSLDPVDGRPLVARYRSAAPAQYALDPAAAPHLRALQSRFPGAALAIEAGSAGAPWLVHVRSAAAKGARVVVYRPGDGSMREILAGLGQRFDRRTVGALPADALALPRPIAWRASDGMRLHGLLLLPPGRDAARAPLVVHVHGGPFNLFRPEFRAQSQLLANRGYVVFEPNFRGSTGFGHDYLRAGRGDFGNGRVQQDIVDGVEALLSQGIGDRARVGILGASFGGYAALQGATFRPDLFKVAVAAVPPADFGWVLRWYAHGVDLAQRGIPLSATLRLLSLDPGDPAVIARLRAQSPIANAGRLTRPVLLLAGGDDERVPIRSVTHYAAALRTLGKDVSLFIDQDGTHQLPAPRTREAYLYLLESMLHATLGGDAPEAATRPLLAHLDRHLALRGDTLQTPATLRSRRAAIPRTAR